MSYHRIIICWSWYGIANVVGVSLITKTQEQMMMMRACGVSAALDVEITEKKREEK